MKPKNLKTELTSYLKRRIEETEHVISLHEDNHEYKHRLNAFREIQSFIADFSAIADLVNHMNQWTPEDLQALATPQSAPASEPATGRRYEVVEGGYSDDSNSRTWFIKDTVTGHGVMPGMKRYYYTTEHEAERAAAALNADSKRYVVETIQHPDPQMFDTVIVRDTLTNAIVFECTSYEPYEAQTEADRLNADSTGQGGE